MIWFNQESLLKRSQVEADIFLLAFEGCHVSESCKAVDSVTSYLILEENPMPQTDIAPGVLLGYRLKNDGQNTHLIHAYTTNSRK